MLLALQLLVLDMKLLRALSMQQEELLLLPVRSWWSIPWTLTAPLAAGRAPTSVRAEGQFGQELQTIWHTGRAEG